MSTTQTGEDRWTICEEKRTVQTGEDRWTTQTGEDMRTTQTGKERWTMQTGQVRKEYCTDRGGQVDYTDS